MKKRDRALKRKGFHQVSALREGAIKTVSVLKDSKGNVAIKTYPNGYTEERIITRYWAK